MSFLLETRTRLPSSRSISALFVWQPANKERVRRESIICFSRCITSFSIACTNFQFLYLKLLVGMLCDTIKRRMLREEVNDGAKARARDACYGEH